jgi:hypothetical protein
MFTSVFTSILSVESSWLLYTHFQHRHYFPCELFLSDILPKVECTAHSWSFLLALLVPPFSRVRRGSSVVIVTHHGLERSRGSGFPHLSRPVLGSTLLLYHGYRVSFSAVQSHGRGFTTHPYIAPRIKKEYTYTSSYPLGLQGLVYGELYVTSPAISATLQDNSCFAEERVAPAVL